jgi:hypothetical protein
LVPKQSSSGYCQPSPAPVMGDHPTLGLKPEALNLAGMGHAEAFTVPVIVDGTLALNLAGDWCHSRSSSSYWWFYISSEPGRGLVQKL